uniref:Uncharacterized protein n=1 Tax=Chenopodium quinoa TaxID=63459 RepID=A0A803M937_CHEQI
MMIAFSAKIKLGFIDGNIPKPASTDVFSAWKRCDAIIISYILRSHDNSIARSVLYLTTSREIWKDLEERYSQTSRLQLFTLQQKLLELNQLRSCSQFIVDNNKKPSPFFSEYWKFPGHTVDKCYKIHGYSPSHGNKFKGKKDTIASSGGSLAQSESIAGAYVADTSIPNEPTPEPSPTQSPHSEPQTLTSYVPIRQSTRPRKWPSHFGNFVYIADNVTEHWCNLVRFEFIPSEAKALINTITQ